MTEVKLKPCPFCGGEAAVEPDEIDKEMCVVRCRGCDGKWGFSFDEASAIAAWNRRASEETT